MKIINPILCSVICIWIAACGKPTVITTNESFEPKIVIDGLLTAGQKVERIRISRNFPVDQNIRNYNLIPDVENTDIILTEMETGNTYPLTFHVAEDNKFENYYWEYNGSDLFIECGKTYRLDVATVINGKNMEAHATATVPDRGFEILAINDTQLRYRERDDQGNIRRFEFTFRRSPATTFYLATIKAIQHDATNYIYDNPFENLEPHEVAEDGDYFEYNWLQDVEPVPGEMTFPLEWYDFWFYTDYQIIMYAVDFNYEQFLQTYNDVQEDDGNYHEPYFNIEGDGIGVFGAVIADTMTVAVVRD